MKKTTMALAISAMVLSASCSAAEPSTAKVSMAKPAAAAQPAAADKDNKPGYWFYKKPPPPPEDEEKAEEEKQQEEAVKFMPDLAAPPPESELLKMPPKQVEKMIEDYREYALYTMEPEKVRWYYEMIDFARRRSRAFMNVTEVVMLSSPKLNMNTEYPTNAPGSTARQQRRESTVTQRLAYEGRNAALIMLTSQGCGFCEAQRGILKFFQQKYGWAIREVDINEHPEAVTRFGTASTPSVFLIVKESQDFMPVAVGVESLPKIEENSYRAIRMLKGETTAQQWTTNEYQDGGMLDPQRK